MCGIYFYQKFVSPKGVEIYKKLLLSDLKSHQTFFSKIAHRGPDNSVFVNDTSMISTTSSNYTTTYTTIEPISKLPYHMLWGFHRLAINGQTPESNQPFFIKNCRLICNGEIYNFRALIKEYGYMTILDQRKESSVPLNNFPIFSPHTTFNPGNNMAPWHGFANNVNVESTLRNQFFGLQDCEQAYYFLSFLSFLSFLNIVGSLWLRVYRHMKFFKVFHIDVVLGVW